jgi:nitroreductase
MNETLKLLQTRRSAKVALLTGPGPSPEELDTILTVAARVPDHKRLVPWRFIVFEGEARARFGNVLATTLAKEDSEAPSPVRLETERQRLMRAPVVVAVISRVVEAPGAPEIEQLLSCGAAAFNLCLAANAMGYGTCWITEWYAFSKGVGEALGLAANERVAGFVYIGTETEKQPDRERPVMAQIVSRWQG